MLKQLMAATGLVALLAVPAMAQEAQDPGAAPELGMAQPEPAPAPLMPVEFSEVTAGQLIRSPVVNASEEPLGKIEDALLAADGKIESVVISFGGFLGFGSKTVQLPIDKVTVMTRGDGAYVVQTDLTPESLEALPGYEKS